ncbi:MAG: cysteine--tRNA ligase [Elusimicrobiota bacterium]|jgi:cysteinyl-tRNA synthetase|nr:cysteine--tRNA ligase [Elusimicrobiota bacterium]
MTIKIYNSLSEKKEEFKPQKENFVSMYICGITPYDFVHLGHARAYVAFDIIKRHFIKRGFLVKHIQNFTDIDDNIIKRAKERNIAPCALADIYIKDYFEQMEKLNILKADKYPRVTETIKEIIDFIVELINKDFAYVKNGDVYFSVDKFKNYGRLSKRRVEDLKAGARIDINADKISPADFALWKKTKEGESMDVSWDSPWGKGRPGWHIECSVMSSSILGDTIDIHGGGQDLLFPHHENEIAQSEAKSGKQFVRYWMHNGFVTVNKEKMSKSLNNFFTLKDILQKYDARVIRYYLLSQHYKSPLDFSDFALEGAKSALQGIDDAYTRLSSAANSLSDEIKDLDLLKIQDLFLNSLDDDFNSEKALSYLHELKNLALQELFKADKNRLSQIISLFKHILEESLGIAVAAVKDNSDIEELLKQRNQVRSAKDWDKADKIRKLIEEKGYKIVDNPDGSSVLTKKI